MHAQGSAVNVESKNGAYITLFYQGSADYDGVVLHNVTVKKK